MGVESLLAAVLAWLATAALHSTAWLVGALLLSAALSRIVHHRVALAAARERLYKLAIFGGLASASFALLAGRAVPIEVSIGDRVAPARELPRVELEAVPSVVAPSLPSIARSLPARIPWVELAAGFWLAGVAGGAVLWLRDRRRLARRLRGRTPLRCGPAAELLAHRLRVLEEPRPDLSLARAPSLTAPITRGLFRPEICIPPRAERDLLDEELDAMLAHELAHARRRDPLLLALCRTVEILFFFQPLLPLVRRRLQDEIEILCDDRAVRWTGDPAALASCLAEVATWIVAGSPEARAVAMAGRRSRLERRVSLLLDRGGKSLPGQGSWILAASAFALCSLALPLPAFAMRKAAPQVELELELPDLVADAPELDLEAERAAIALLLDSLEVEFGELSSLEALETASEELRARLQDIGARLRTLRDLQAELDRSVAEELSAESENRT